MDSNEFTWSDNLNSTNGNAVFPNDILNDKTDFPNNNRVTLNDKTVFPELSFFNKKNKNEGKFLIMKSLESEKSFANLSPFWIKKGVDGITADTSKIMKQKDGTLLICTNSNKGTDNLLKATAFGGIMKINVEEHRSLNDRQGIIYCPDLNNVEITDILSELKEQSIKQIHPMTKLVDNKIVRMGLYVVTFNTQVLPEFVIIGYLKVRVRIFIPNPMKCKKCLAYGHTKNWCKEVEEFCNKCSEKLPHNSCDNKLCKNCQGDHFSNFKKCPVYIKEAKIMEIKTIQNVSINEAKRRYSLMFDKPINNDSSYGEVTGNINNQVLEEIENLKKEIQILKTKEILSSEKLIKETKRNDNLMEVNSNLIQKLKELQKNHSDLKKEKRLIENKSKDPVAQFLESDGDEFESSISDVDQLTRNYKSVTSAEQRKIELLDVGAGSSKRSVEDRNSSEDNDFQPSRKKVNKKVNKK